MRVLLISDSGRPFLEHARPHIADFLGAAVGSETRDDRISEYHTVWDNPVVGIEEGTLLRVDGGAVTVCGRGRIKMFARGAAPRWFGNGERLPV